MKESTPYLYVELPPAQAAYIQTVIASMRTLPDISMVDLLTDLQTHGIGSLYFVPLLNYLKCAGYTCRVGYSNQDDLCSVPASLPNGCPVNLAPSTTLSKLKIQIGAGGVDLTHIKDDTSDKRALFTTLDPQRDWDWAHLGSEPGLPSPALSDAQVDQLFLFTLIGAPGEIPYLGVLKEILNLTENNKLIFPGNVSMPFHQLAALVSVAFKDPTVLNSYLCADLTALLTDPCIERMDNVLREIITQAFSNEAVMFGGNCPTPDLINQRMLDAALFKGDTIVYMPKDLASFMVEYTEPPIQIFGQNFHLLPSIDPTNYTGGKGIENARHTSKFGTPGADKLTVGDPTPSGDGDELFPYQVVLGGNGDDQFFVTFALDEKLTQSSGFSVFGGNGDDQFSIRSVVPGAIYNSNVEMRLDGGVGNNTYNLNESPSLPAQGIRIRDASQTGSIFYNGTQLVGAQFSPYNTYHFGPVQAHFAKDYDVVIMTLTMEESETDFILENVDFTQGPFGWDLWTEVGDFYLFRNITTTPLPVGGAEAEEYIFSGSVNQVVNITSYHVATKTSSNRFYTMPENTSLKAIELDGKNYHPYFQSVTGNIYNEDMRQIANCTQTMYSAICQDSQGDFKFQYQCAPTNTPPKICGNLSFLPGGTVKEYTYHMPFNHGKFLLVQQANQTATTLTLYQNNAPIFTMLEANTLLPPNPSMAFSNGELMLFNLVAFKPIQKALWFTQNLFYGQFQHLSKPQEINHHTIQIVEETEPEFFECQTEDCLTEFTECDPEPCLIASSTSSLSFCCRFVKWFSQKVAALGDVCVEKLLDVAHEAVEAGGEHYGVQKSPAMLRGPIGNGYPSSACQAYGFRLFGESPIITPALQAVCGNF